MKVILINGPPRSGKDTLANSLVDLLGATSEITTFKEEILTQLSLESLFAKSPYESDQEFYERTKDSTPKLRALLIAYAEKCIKPIFGQDYFAKQAVLQLKRLAALGHSVVVIPDLGFIEEYQTVKEAFPDTLVVKMQREGFNFSKDSRSDLDIPTDLVIKNLGINSLQLAARQIVEQFKLKNEQ